MVKQRWLWNGDKIFFLKVSRAYHSETIIHNLQLFYLYDVYETGWIFPTPIQSNSTQDPANPGQRWKGKKIGKQDRWQKNICPFLTRYLSNSDNEIVFLGMRSKHLLSPVVGYCCFIIACPQGRSARKHTRLGKQSSGQVMVRCHLEPSVIPSIEMICIRRQRDPPRTVRMVLAHSETIIARDV